MRIMILIVALLIAPVLVAEDTIYQWTDKEGNVHFSGKPPPEGTGTQVVEKNLQPIPKVGTVDPYMDSDDIKKATAERVARENEELTLRRLEATTYDEQQAIECGVAQSVIDRLSSARMAKIASADGTLRIMSDAEREDRIRTSQKFIDENCQK